MIPAIFALLSITLGDGHYKNGFFEHEDPIKIIRHHVVEEDWEEEAVALTKAHITKMHELKNEGALTYHELIKAAKNRSTTDQNIDTLVHKILEIENKQNQNWIDSRFDLSRKMSSDEFYNMMESTKTLDRIKEENDKSRSISKQKRVRYFATLEQAIDQHLTDKSSKDEIEAMLDNFKRVSLTALDSIDQIKYYQDPRLDNHHATRTELSSFSNRILEYDKLVLEAYLQLHKKLTKLTSDKDWHEIDKIMHRAYH